MTDDASAEITRGIHDLGGLPAGPIDRDEHSLSNFELRVDALMMLMIGPFGAFRADALRRAIEEYNNDDYTHLAYYERWVRALRILLVEQGVLTAEQIDARMAAIRARVEHGGGA